MQLPEATVAGSRVGSGSDRDIISDVRWEVEPEVEEWLDGITLKEFAPVLPRIEQLGERGSALRMPASRSLGEGLLTVFRKQRMNERHEVERARIAMRRCIAEGHTAEED